MPGLILSLKIDALMPDLYEPIREFVTGRLGWQTDEAATPDGDAASANTAAICDTADAVVVVGCHTPSYRAVLAMPELKSEP